MNSGRGLTGVLDPGLTTPITSKVTGPSFWAVASRAERREAGSVARLSWAVCGNGWPAGLFAGAGWDEWWTGIKTTGTCIEK
jgi:hypothetical protein